MYGELNPIGGGDPIPLLKTKLLIGRRESCDITLRFDNVSTQHCELTLTDGYWYVKDLNSRNGVKINGKRIEVGFEKLLEPGNQLSIARHVYDIRYSPYDLGAVGPPPREDEQTDTQKILSKSLLERLGLQGNKVKGDKESSRRYDIMNDKGGSFKNPNKPV